MHILLIEDSDLQATVFVFELQQHGHKVSRAHDGEEGLRMLREIQPDIVLLDIIMKGTDGFSVLQARQQDPTLQTAPVIMLTNLRDPSDIEQAKQMGAADYFVKNKMQIEELLAKIKEVTGKNAPGSN